MLNQTTLSKQSHGAVLSNSPLISDAEGQGGWHLRWAFLDPSALSLPVSPGSDWTGLISARQVSLLVFSSLTPASRLLTALLSSTQFKAEQDFQQINKQKPLPSLHCFQIHKSLVIFSVNGQKQEGPSSVDWEWRCVTWNLVLCRAWCPMGFRVQGYKSRRFLKSILEYTIVRQHLVLSRVEPCILTVPRKWD